MIIIPIFRADEISNEIRALLREVAETDAVPHRTEQGREETRAQIAKINDLLDTFLPN